MHRYTDAEVEDVLAAANVVQAWYVSARGRFTIFLGLLVVCVILGVAYQWLVASDPAASALPNGANVAAVFVAGVAAAFAYYQWSDTRRESSLEKFYERLKLTNDRYADWEHARAIVPHFWGWSNDEAEFQRRMYAYLELDNLEYMIVRYQRGFVRGPLMRRAVRTFASRCEAPAFRSLARHLVKGSGYLDETVEVVRELAHRASLRQS